MSKRINISASEQGEYGIVIPLEECYILKRPYQDVYIKKAVFPPRLCEWTPDIDEAQTFENIREVSNAAEYIKLHAWQIIATDMNGVPIVIPRDKSSLVIPTPPDGRILKEGEIPEPPEPPEKRVSKSDTPVLGIVLVVIALGAAIGLALRDVGGF
jgi:hypothetical protein